MDVMSIKLPDGLVVYTHDLRQEHVDKVVRQWTDQHSDEYELVPIHVDVIKAGRDKYEGLPGREQLVHREGDVIGSSAWMEEGTGKKRPKCDFQLLDMPEAEYRELVPYHHDPTCRVRPS